ncbi:MAG TPA: hypothetical protein VIN60_00615 [Anaerolineales bacterium]
MNPRDLELLSAYLDGQLNPSDSARLKSRLASDESLRAVLDNLRATRNLLRQLPSRRAPRNFTLTPQMAGIKPPTPRAVLVFRFASAFATFLFIITFVLNGLLSFSVAAPAPAAFNAAAPMSAQEAAPLAGIAPTETSAPRLMAAPLATTETPMPLGGGLSKTATETSTPEFALRSIPLQPRNSQPVNSQTEPSVPFALEILFGILAIGFGVTAWILPRTNERNLRKKWNKK